MHTTMMTAPPPPRAHEGDSDPDMDEALRRVREGRSERAQLPASSHDLFLRHRDRGFVAHMTATVDTLSTVRSLAGTVPVEYGADREAANGAQLVVSELVGNAVRACGADVPLLVEVYVVADDIAVTVHDPAPEVLPHRRETPMDNADAESGRGLLLLDALAPGWTTEASPIGKQINCRVRVA